MFGQNYSNISFQPKLTVIEGEKKDIRPDLLQTIIEGNLVDYSERTALIYNDFDDEGMMSKEMKLSYGELDLQANQLARAIWKNLATPKINYDGDFVVAVCMLPSINLIVTLLAIWKAGGGYLPIDILQPPNMIQLMLDETAPLLLILDSKYGNSSVFKLLNTISFATLKFDAQFLPESKLITEKILTKDKSVIACILYTSGTTSGVKGVRITHQNIMNRLEWQFASLPYNEPSEAHSIFKTNYTFVDSIAEIWAPLMQGLALVVAPRSIPSANLILLLEKYQIERITLVPRQLSNLLEYLMESQKEQLLPQLKTFISSGERLTIQLAQKFFKYFDDGKHCLYNFYGLTEAMGDVTYFKCENKEQIDKMQSIPLGKIIQNTLLYVLDENFGQINSYTRGQVHISGKSLSEGFVNRNLSGLFEQPSLLSVSPAPTSTFYKTDDCVSYEDNVILYHGKMADQIEIDGYTYSLLEIENCILDLDGVESAVALSECPAGKPNKLYGFIILKTTHKDTTTFAMESQLKTKLPFNLVPRIIILEEFPYLLNDKVDRRALFKLKDFCDYNDVRDEIEYNFAGVSEAHLHGCLDLFDTLVQVIGTEIPSVLSIDKNYFDIGGTSVNSVITVGELNKRGYSISLPVFIAAESLEQIISKICDKSKESLLSAVSMNIHLQLSAARPTDDNKETIKNMISSSLLEKGSLQKYLKPQLQADEYCDLIDSIWEKVKEQNLSFMVLDSDEKTIGASINLELSETPNIITPKNISSITELTNLLRKPLVELELPQGRGQILDAYLTGISSNLTPQDTVAVALFIDNEIINKARENNFTGVISTNTSLMEEQIRENIYGFKKLCDYPANKFISHTGRKPFINAPDNLRGSVYFRDVKESDENSGYQ